VTPEVGKFANGTTYEVAPDPGVRITRVDDGVYGRADPTAAKLPEV